jgi:hypothetical protein
MPAVSQAYLALQAGGIHLFLWLGEKFSADVAEAT